MNKRRRFRPIADSGKMPDTSCMKQRVRSVGSIAEAGLFASYMLVVFPIVAIGVGMSGGKVLSPIGFLTDFRTLDPAILLRLIAWLALLLPPFWIASFIRRQRRSRPGDVR
jgi:hypothetical protein